MLTAYKNDEACLTAFSREKMICVIINERKTWTTGVKIRDENL